jgi:hypothetical protein
MKPIVRIALCILAAVVFIACGSGAGPGSGGDVSIRINASALSTRGDIAALTVRLTPTSGGAPIEDLAVGAPSSWSIVFGQLPIGDYGIYAKAVDAAQNTLYETPNPYPGGPVTVTTGGTTQVTLILQELRPPSAPVDSAPFVTSLYASQLHLDQTTVVRLDASAVDPDPTDALTFKWTATGGSFGAPTGDATTTHSTWTAPGDGAFTVTVTATDGGGSSAQLSIDLEVSAADGEGSVVAIVGLNSPPQIVSLTSSNSQAVAGQPIPLSALASDLDGDAVTFSWSTGCAGGFGPDEITSEAGGTRDTTSYTVLAAPASGSCLFRLTASDPQGTSSTGIIIIALVTPTVGEGPQFRLEGSGVDLSPGGVLDVKALPSDGGSHPTWSYAWSDGRKVGGNGTFTALVAGDDSHQLYAPADCATLDGDPAIGITAVVIDTATGASAQKSLAIVVHCPAAM